MGLAPDAGLFIRLGRIFMETRISGGSKRGHKLRTYGGVGLRPTSEKVRSAIFSLIGPESVIGAKVLDLYAGTGALGIEALSRGADTVEFVESNPKTCGYIRRNVEDFGFAERTRITRGRVERVIGTLRTRFDLVLADPPYRSDPWEELLEGLQKGSILEEEAIVVAEHASRHEMADSYGDLSIWKRRRYGDTTVSLYRNGG